MKNPLVSIIIPTYNRATLIRKSIKSVLNQTHNNFEIIIVDDGSTDNTEEVVKSIQGPILYIRKTNSGPSPSRNVGIKEAKGEFVAFLDSDDVWDSTKLEKQLKCFEQNPQAVMVSCNYRFIDQDDRVVKDPGSLPGYVPSDLIIKDMVRIKFPFGSTTQFMFKRSVFNTVGVFNERLRISEDLDLLIRIGTKFKVGYVDEVLTSIRLHQNHLMRETPRYQVWLNSVTVYRSHENEISKIVPNPRIFFVNFYGIAGNSALLSGNRLKALELHFQGVLLQPLRLKGYKDCARCFLPMSYLKMRHEKSLKVEVSETMKKYQ